MSIDRLLDVLKQFVRHRLEPVCLPGIGSGRSQPNPAIVKMLPYTTIAGHSWQCPFLYAPAGVCRCDDGCDYVVKDGSKNICTPHDEWFCTRLAELIGIPSPPCIVIERADGALVFGSRWEGGVARDPWWEMVKRGDIALTDISDPLSRIYAFDHFVHNDDRHLKNFLFREQRNGWMVLAFDYSRAWLCNGMPLPSLPFQANKNTILARRFLCHELGEYIDKAETDLTLNRLANVKETDVLNAINGHPEMWLSSAQKDEIVNWWRSNTRTNRIDQIRQGIHDGTYL
jgi:hypothetical protein